MSSHYRQESIMVPFTSCAPAVGCSGKYYNFKKSIPKHNYWLSSSFYTLNSAIVQLSGLLFYCWPHVRFNMKWNITTSKISKISYRCSQYLTLCICYVMEYNSSLFMHIVYCHTLCPCMCSRCLFLEIPLLYMLSSKKHKIKNPTQTTQTPHMYASYSIRVITHTHNDD